MSFEQFTDEIVIEDFQESGEVSKPREKTNSICKTELCNIILINNKTKNLIHNNIKYESDHVNSECSEMKLSNCLNNFDKKCLSDTISFESESNEENCSGSSLHKFDSTNTSDSFDDETFLGENQKQRKNINFTSDEFLNELKTAIKVKWIDRAICIKKSIQQKNQDLLDNYIKTFTLEKELAKKNEKKHCAPIVEERAEGFWNNASNEKIIFVNTEIECSMIAANLYIPFVTSIYREYSIKIQKRKLHNSIINKVVVSCTNISVKKSSNLRSLRKNRKIRSKSESKYITFQNNPEFLQKNNPSESLQSKNQSLIIEINSKKETFEQLWLKYNDLTRKLEQSNCDLRLAYQVTQKLKDDFLKSKKIIENYEIDNLNLHNLNVNLKLFQRNAEHSIQTEQKNNEILSKQIESYKEMEYDCEWLYTAFVDYKSLGQDYDNLQFRYYETQIHLDESIKVIDILKDKMQYLEKEISDKNIILDKTNKTNYQYHEKCQCQTLVDSNCLYSRSRSKRIKHKDNKLKRQERFSDEFDTDTKLMKQPNEINNLVEKTSFKFEPSLTDVNQLERKYDNLQIKKRTLESELCHVPINGVSSIRQSHASSRGEKEYIENELDLVDQEISSIRRTLKQCNVMGDRTFK